MTSSVFVITYLRTHCIAALIFEQNWSWNKVDAFTSCHSHCNLILSAPLQSPTLHYSVAYSSPFHLPPAPHHSHLWTPNPPVLQALLSPFVSSTAFFPQTPRRSSLPALPIRQPSWHHLEYASPLSCPLTPTPQQQSSGSSSVEVKAVISCTKGQGQVGHSEQAKLLPTLSECWVHTGALLPLKKFCRRHWQGTQGQTWVCLLPSA